MDKEVSCETCTAACCKKGMSLNLNDTEKNTLESSGTILSIVPSKDKIQTLAVRFGLSNPNYLLESDCGLLSKTTEFAGKLACSIHYSEEFPDVCREFPVGGYACRELRARAGVDTTAEFNDWLKLTSES
jgi:Fe-S-cluster containining protein